MADAVITLINSQNKHEIRTLINQNAVASRLQHSSTHSVN